MLPNIVKKLILRDLARLRLEIESYKNEKNIWLTDKEITNSAGNLCLHLTGNLRHFIGAILGNTDYKRNREEEFSLKNISRSVLLQNINDTITATEKTLDHLSDEQLALVYPVKVFEPDMTTGYFLVHLAMHLDYHLGQINYHRRLLDAVKANNI